MDSLRSKLRAGSDGHTSHVLWVLLGTVALLGSSSLSAQLPFSIYEPRSAQAKDQQRPVIERVTDAVSPFAKPGENNAAGAAQANWQRCRDYHHGTQLIPKSPQLAFMSCQQAAQAGHAQAQVQLAEFYERGLGTQRDDAKAVQWLHRAAEQSQCRAQLLLGWRYLSGRGVEQDFRKSLMLREASAQGGCAEGQYEWAKTYWSGSSLYSIEPNPMLAIPWFQKAAEQGHAGANYELSKIYQRGQYVQKSESKSEHYLRVAAAKGHIFAQYDLAKLDQQRAAAESARREREAALAKKSAKKQAERRRLEQRQPVEDQWPTRSWKETHKEPSRTNVLRCGFSVNRDYYEAYRSWARQNWNRVLDEGECELLRSERWR